MLMAAVRKLASTETMCRRQWLSRVDSALRADPRAPRTPALWCATRV